MRGWLARLRERWSRRPQALPWRQETIEIATLAAERFERAEILGLLALAERIGTVPGGPRWFVTHVPTGCLVWAFRDRATAREFVERMWQVPGWDTVTATRPMPALRAEVQRALDDLGVW